MFLDKSVKAILKYATKPHPYDTSIISGVHLSKDKATIIHNAHYLIQVDLPKDFTQNGFPVFPGIDNPKEQTEPVVVMAEELDKALSHLPKKTSLPILETALVCKGPIEQSVAVLSTNLETHNSPVLRKLEGAYPKATLIIPAEKPSYTIGLNARYLMETCKAMIDAGVGDSESPGLVYLEIRKAENTPIVLRGKIGDSKREILSVIMPVRKSELNKETEVREDGVTDKN